MLNNNEKKKTFIKSSFPYLVFLIAVVLLHELRHHYFNDNNMSSSEYSKKEQIRIETKDEIGVTVDATHHSKSPPPPPPTRLLFETDKDAFFYSFFAENFKDVEKLKGLNISKAKMFDVVRRSSRKLSLYELSRKKSDEGQEQAEWKYVAGQRSWWSTNEFHDFMRTNANAIVSKYLPDSFTDAFFVINCFDEPMCLGACPKLDELEKIHGSVRREGFSLQESVIWSMSKVDECHDDLLFPFPDFFGHYRHYLNSSSREEKLKIINATQLSNYNAFRNISLLKEWDKRSNVIKFRGSSTGSSKKETNLRSRSMKALQDEPGYDLGITDFIQGHPDVGEYKKERMPENEFSNYKALLDIDGNSHSFNRQLVIGRAGAAILRINVFHDWFSRGLLSGEFTFDLETSDDGIVSSARKFRDEILNTENVRLAAMGLHALTFWLDESVGVRYMGEMIKRYVDSVKFIY